MTRRVEAPDTDADIKLRQLLDERPSPSFLMVAGAGSGKTTSLVKALLHVKSSRGEELSAHGQRIACVTYTEVARDEILTDLQDGSTFHVSTIHAFLWELVKAFQGDIKRWAISKAAERISSETAKRDKARPQTKAYKNANDRIKRYSDQLGELDSVTQFTYGPGSNFGRGLIGHSDVITMALELLQRPLLASVAVREFPFVFVDESQDTFPNVVDALRELQEKFSEDFCLGFFGDPMQQIYTAGVGSIVPLKDWEPIEKPENFRSPARVLELINSIRSPSDDLVQKSGLRPDELKDGEVRLFVLPRSADRVASLAKVRTWLADRHGNSPNWVDDGPESAVKVLVITHRMAAKRLSFEHLYEVFHDKAPQYLSDAFDEGRAWPLSPFLNAILPLVDALDSSADVMSLLKSHSPLFRDLARSEDTEQTLATLKAGLRGLSEVFESSGTIGSCLEVIRGHGLVELEERWMDYLDKGTGSATLVQEEVESVLDQLVATSIDELRGYRRYAKSVSPYSTQQGVKGAEFPHVIVILDDEEGAAHTQFSYDKLFGIRELSDRDRAAKAEGRDSVLERTRRLLYVCCSRATESLAILLYTEDVGSAKAALADSSLACIRNVLTLEDLERADPPPARGSDTSDEQDDGQQTLF